VPVSKADHITLIRWTTIDFRGEHNMRGNSALAIVLGVIGVICLVLAVIYFTLKTNLLASGHPIRHTERAVVLIIVAVVCLVGAYVARPRRLA
jgi:uncharacterized membrane protein